MSKCIITRFLVLTAALTSAIIRSGFTGIRRGEACRPSVRAQHRHGRAMVRRSSAALSQIRPRFSTRLHRLVRHCHGRHERGQRQRGY